MKALFTHLVTGLALIALGTGCITGTETSEAKFAPVFEKDGIPEGWRVGEWNDVSKAPANGARWYLTNGVLYGSDPRGTWLMSEKQYENFILEYEFKLGPRGNSGLALRAPMAGDPAFDGMELQMADYRYNTSAKDSELTGGLYRALAPTKQVYKPEEWNRYRVELRGSHIKVTLNDQVIQNVDLDTQTEGVLRHDGKPASALKDRPRRGHIGFQELSRSPIAADGKAAPIVDNNDRVKIRKFRILELP